MSQMCDVMIQFPERAATIVLHKELPCHMAIGEIEYSFLITSTQQQQPKNKKPKPTKVVSKVVCSKVVGISASINKRESA